MTHTILLIGSGNIGRRHLQALLAADEAVDLDITVVEPFEQAREATAALLAATEGLAAERAKRVAIVPSIQDAPLAADLGIIATDVAPRRAAFDAARKHARIDAWVFEKVLFQTRRDLDEVESILGSDATPAFVNCGRRGFPSYQALREQFAGKEPVNLRVRGSRFGLGSNAVHFTDLAALLSGNRLVEIDGSGLAPGFEQSKRAGYVEIYGRLSGRFENGGRIEIECLADGNEPITVHVASRAMEATIHEAAGKIEIVDGGVSKTQPFEIRYVSQMPYLFTDILTRGSSDLTPYSVSAEHHRLLIDAVRMHLGLSIDKDEPCPIS